MKSYAKFGYAAPFRFRVILEKPQGGGGQNDPPPPPGRRLNGFHNPFTRHRNRHGGGVALYAHSSLPIKRLNDLEIEGEEWIWAQIKLHKFTLLIC